MLNKSSTSDVSKHKLVFTEKGVSVPGYINDSMLVIKLAVC